MCRICLCNNGDSQQLLRDVDGRHPQVYLAASTTHRPDAATSITAEMRAKAATACREAADTDPANLAAADAIRRYLMTATDRKQRTLQAIADHLNARGVYTTTGRPHTPTSVNLLCRRYEIAR